MLIEALDHVNIEAKDIDASAKFYQDVIGLEPGNRPGFERDGHWMYANGIPIVHIITPMPDNALLTGSKDAAISHFAMRIYDVKATMEHLDTFGVEYNQTTVPGTSMRQLFFEDPDGVLIELIHIPEGGR